MGLTFFIHILQLLQSYFTYFRCNFQYKLEKNVGKVHISPDTCPAHQTETSAASGFQGEWITTELYSSECGVWIATKQKQSSKCILYALLILYPIIMPASIHIQVCICGVYIPREGNP